MRTSLELKKKNVLDILKIIVQSQSITKNDVAIKTGLTIVTINTVINDLLKKGILIEDGIADSIGGRPASLYKLNSSQYFMIGVNLGINELSIRIANLSLEEVFKNCITVENGDKLDNILDKTKNMLYDALKNLNISIEAVLGMGVTVPGPVDTHKGIIHSLPNVIGWENVRLKEVFEKEFGFKVFVEKDTYASVLSVRNQYDLGLKNAVVLILRGGIGSGVLLNGDIFRGENGIAGELGHVSLEMNGPQCSCGNVGCLEVYASDYAIVNEVIIRLKQGNKSSIQNLLKEDKEVDLSSVIEAAKQKDELCCDVLLRASRYVGTAISNIIKVYDPSYVIIESKWIKEVPGIFESVVTMCKSKTTLLQNSNVKIVLNNQKDIYLTGAVMLVQDYFLNSISDNKLLR